jgi:hypothetical protein
MVTLLLCRRQGRRLAFSNDINARREGHEFEVLQGSQQVLKRAPQPIWMVEITRRNHLGAHFTELTEAAVAEFLHGGDPPSSDNFLLADQSIGKTVSRLSP